MVLLACWPGAVLVDVTVDVDVEVEVLVDVDVLVLALLSEPQPTSARPKATVAIAAVKFFMYWLLPRNAPVPATGNVGMTLAEPRHGGSALDHFVLGQPAHHLPAGEDRQ